MQLERCRRRARRSLNKNATSNPCLDPKNLNRRATFAGDNIPCDKTQSALPTTRLTTGSRSKQAGCSGDQFGATVTLPQRNLSEASSANKSGFSGPRQIAARHRPHRMPCQTENFAPSDGAGIGRSPHGRKRNKPRWTLQLPARSAESPHPN
jgi:hypothetical protein